MRWITHVRQQFKNRDELQLRALQHEFGEDIDAEDLRRVLSVFEREYGIPMGALRPGDQLDIFLSPRPGGGLLDALAAGDRAGELEAVLAASRKQLGLKAVPDQIPGTLGDFVLCSIGRR